MQEMIEGQVGNSGRGNHGMALVAARKLFNTRSLLAKLFHISNPNDIAFMSNTTEALNLAIKGWLKPGDHVVATMVEHNSVRRPLEFLRRTIGIEVDYVPVSPQGEMEIEVVRSTFRSNTTLLVCSHSSNLLGSISPVRELSQLAHEYGAIMLLDAAQTAGNYPIDVEELGVDLLAFPGHKGLLGPQGTGGLYISPELDLVPLLHGGTGSQSEELEQPAVRPDRYEAGTANTVGIAGLGEAVKYVIGQGPEKIYQHERELTQRLMMGLSEIPGLTILGPEIGKDRTGIVSFILADRDASEVAFLLDRNYGIAVRAGYHCTPLGHMTAGTMEGGAVRASIGYNTVVDEVDALVLAIKRITE
jgi:cysteine desulfurase family protein